MKAREAWTDWYEKRTKLEGSAPKPNKYGATRVQLDGIWFDSQREAARYAELRLMEAASLVSDITVHPAYPLIVGEEEGPPWVFHTIGLYHADFKYFHQRDGVWVVEDVKCKATRTEAYKLRKRLVEARYQITIVEMT